MRHGLRSIRNAGALAVAGALALSVIPWSHAQSTEIAALDALSKGEWTIRFRDGSQSRKVCVRTGEELLQIRHGMQGCSQVLVDNKAGEATVQYTCKGNGYGRTTVRLETSSLVQINSQGFADDRPFRFHAEARHTGKCS